MGIIFEKVVTKTDLSYRPVGDLRSAGDPSAAIDYFRNSVSCGRHVVYFVFVTTFSKIIPRTILTQFSKVYAKNQTLGKERGLEDGGLDPEMGPWVDMAI